MPAYFDAEAGGSDATMHAGQNVSATPATEETASQNHANDTFNGQIVPSSAASQEIEEPREELVNASFGIKFKAAPAPKPAQEIDPGYHRFLRGKLCHSAG